MGRRGEVTIATPPPNRAWLLLTFCSCFSGRKNRCPKCRRRSHLEKDQNQTRIRTSDPRNVPSHPTSFSISQGTGDLLYRINKHQNAGCCWFVPCHDSPQLTFQPFRPDIGGYIDGGVSGVDERYVCGLTGLKTEQKGREGKSEKIGGANEFTINRLPSRPSGSKQLPRCLFPQKGLKIVASPRSEHNRQAPLKLSSLSQHELINQGDKIVRAPIPTSSHHQPIPPETPPKLFITLGNVFSFFWYLRHQTTPPKHHRTSDTDHLFDQFQM